MRTYKRLRIEGGCYFFTVNLATRTGNDLLIREIGALREAFRQTRADRPFEIDAIVILPDHLHAIWQMPPNDDDFSTRWRLIKSRFSQRIESSEAISASRLKTGERGIWQRRFWKHAIRDERDYTNHLDYIHYNPVKHGYCEHVTEWPHSSFHRWVERGVYPLHCAAGEDIRALSLD